MPTTLRLILLLTLGLLGLQPVGYAYGVASVLVSEVQYAATVSSEIEANAVESPAQMSSNSGSDKAAWDSHADTREISDFVAAESGGLETMGFKPPPGTRQIPEGIPDSWRIKPTKGQGPEKGSVVHVCS